MKNIVDHIFAVLGFAAIIGLVILIGYALTTSALDFISSYRDIVILVLAVLLLRAQQKIDKIERQLARFTQDQRARL